MQQGRKEQLERRTFDLPSSSTGRMWEEERRQRKKECVKDSQMSHSWGGVGGPGQSGVLGAPSVPPDMLECPGLGTGSPWPG